MDEGPRATGVFDYCIEERCKSSPLKEDALTPSSPVYFYRSADEWSSMCWSGVNPALLCVMCVHANKIASTDRRLVMGMSLDLQVRNKTVKTPKKNKKNPTKVSRLSKSSGFIFPRGNRECFDNPIRWMLRYSVAGQRCYLKWRGSHGCENKLSDPKKANNGLVRLFFKCVSLLPSLSAEGSDVAQQTSININQPGGIWWIWGMLTTCV